MTSTNLVHEFWSEIASPNANRNNVGQKLSSGATKRARANLLGKFFHLIQSIVDLLNKTKCTRQGQKSLKNSTYTGHCSFITLVSGGLNSKFYIFKTKSWNDLGLVAWTLTLSKILNATVVEFPLQNLEHDILNGKPRKRGCV